MHSLSEIDRPEFREFLDQAIRGFGKFADRARQNPEDLMPWKVLGRKWHLVRKGFALNKTIQWEPEVLEELLELLADICPQGQFLWNNKQMVPIYVPQQKEPWATVQTKRPDGVYLNLVGPKGRIAYGRVMHLGFDPELDAERPDGDLIRLKFRTLEQIHAPDLATLLKQHLAEVAK